MAGALPYLGTTLYIQTEQSRRKATVIASKPGHILIQYHQ